MQTHTQADVLASCGRTKEPPNRNPGGTTRGAHGAGEQASEHVLRLTGRGAATSARNPCRHVQGRTALVRVYAAPSWRHASAGQNACCGRFCSNGARAFGGLGGGVRLRQARTPSG